MFQTLSVAGKGFPQKRVRGEAWLAHFQITLLTCSFPTRPVFPPFLPTSQADSNYTVASVPLNKIPPTSTRKGSHRLNPSTKLGPPSSIQSLRTLPHCMLDARVPSAIASLITSCPQSTQSQGKRDPHLGIQEDHNGTFTLAQILILSLPSLISIIPPISENHSGRPPGTEKGGCGRRVEPMREPSPAM